MLGRHKGERLGPSAIPGPEGRCCKKDTGPSAVRGCVSRGVVVGVWGGREDTNGSMFPSSRHHVFAVRALAQTGRRVQNRHATSVRQDSGSRSGSALRSAPLGNTRPARIQYSVGTCCIRCMAQEGPDPLGCGWLGRRQWQVGSKGCPCVFRPYERGSETSQSPCARWHSNTASVLFLSVA